MAFLELTHVEAFYGKIRALKGIDLNVEQGEIVTLIGANGAGKSTTLKAISGLMKLRAEAKITFDGEDITHLPPHEIAARGIAHVRRGAASSRRTPCWKICGWARISAAARPARRSCWRPRSISFRACASGCGSRPGRSPAESSRC